MAELSMPLSKNFVLKEFLRSSTAERDEGLKQEQENPPPEITLEVSWQRFKWLEKSTSKLWICC